MCNPAPIFNEHFTVSNVNHTPQQIFDKTGILLELADLCNNEYTIFYNGPKCGASAPDHFHFQACPANELITENDFLTHPEKFKVIKETQGVIIRFIKSDDYLRNVLILSSQNQNEIEKVFKIIYKNAFKRLNEIDYEPLMNLLALKKGQRLSSNNFSKRKASSRLLLC